MIEFLNAGKSVVKIDFPFDGSLNGNPNETLTKVLFINYKESTQIKNADILALSNHIRIVMSADNYEIIHRGKLIDDYYDIVDRIAFDHGIYGNYKGKPTKDIILLHFHPTEYLKCVYDYSGTQFLFNRYVIEKASID